MSETSLKTRGVEVSIFPINNGKRGKPYHVLPPPKTEKKQQKIKGQQEVCGYIEVTAGQRYGIEVLLHREFDFMGQPTVGITHGIDGEAICITEAIQRNDKKRRDGVYECVSQTDDGNRGFTFATRELDEGASQRSDESEEFIGSIEVQLSRGHGVFSPVPQKNRFGRMARDTVPLPSAKGTKDSINKYGKQLYTASVDVGGNAEDVTWWLEWAIPINIEDPFPLKQSRELIIFTFKYRIKAYLDREGIVRKQKRRGSRENFLLDVQSIIPIAGSEHGDDGAAPVERESPHPVTDLPADRDSLSEFTPGYEAGHRSGHEVEESERDSPAYSGPALPSERDSLYRRTPVPIKQENPEPEPELSEEDDSLYDVTPGYESRNASGHDVEGDVSIGPQSSQAIIKSTRPSISPSPGHEIEEEVPIQLGSPRPIKLSAKIEYLAHAILAGLDGDKGGSVVKQEASAAREQQEESVAEFSDETRRASKRARTK